MEKEYLGLASGLAFLEQGNVSRLTQNLEREKSNLRGMHLCGLYSKQFFSFKRKNLIPLIPLTPQRVNPSKSKKC